MVRSLKIQIQERARRKRERIKMRGLPTPPGTKPREPWLPLKPAWQPMAFPSFDIGSILRRIHLPGSSWRHRQAEPPQKILPDKEREK
jgi:hypothetical protein